MPGLPRNKPHIVLRYTLSHETALVLYGISDANPGAIHLTVPVGARRRREAPKAVQVQRADLAPAEITVLEGLPVTTIGRTVGGSNWQSRRLVTGVRRGRSRPVKHNGFGGSCGPVGGGSGVMNPRRRLPGSPTKPDLPAVVMIKQNRRRFVVWKTFGYHFLPA